MTNTTNGKQIFQNSILANESCSFGSILVCHNFLFSSSTAEGSSDFSYLIFQQMPLKILLVFITMIEIENSNSMKN